MCSGAASRGGAFDLWALGWLQAVSVETWGVGCYRIPPAGLSEAFPGEKLFPFVGRGMGELQDYGSWPHKGLLRLQ